MVSRKKKIQDKLVTNGRPGSKSRKGCVFLFWKTQERIRSPKTNKMQIKKKVPQKTEEQSCNLKVQKLMHGKCGNSGVAKLVNK